MHRCKVCVMESLPLQRACAVALQVKNPLASAGDTGDGKFDPWVVKIPWRRKRLPTPVFLPGKYPTDREAWGATVHGVAKESDFPWVWELGLKAVMKTSQGHVLSNSSLLGFRLVGRPRLSCNRWTTLPLWTLLCGAPCKQPWFLGCPSPGITLRISRPSQHAWDGGASITLMAQTRPPLQRLPGHLHHIQGRPALLNASSG